ncbi:DNA polymerase I [Liquorilactobacillus oeni]|uniref:DNA polymerase I n=1 Tax=Liquorilactobacillus oeni DSM 19972 TaxID=1423777 RepID=A0A0R1MJQ9_9LACO|nr:DNA polymerase I [Liquorilactobacillus oeni]KRL04755.1 DNA polymerase I [Liquorilactobacillus oeni DSM 19972]
MNIKKKLLLIDGNSVAFRAFFALHQSLDRFVSHNGLHTNAIYGFNTMLDRIIENTNPTHTLVAFDAAKETFRNAKYSNYKGGRAKTPSELSEQLPYLKKLLEAYGIKSYELIDYEADDIIGTLAKKAEKEGFEVTIVTGDRDLTQLATDRTTVSVTQKGVSETESYTPDHVLQKYGITPGQIIDMKGLVGDSSDNYPGVAKVGEKTALKLLKQFGTIEKLYDNLDKLKPSKMKEHLEEDQKIAFLCKDLARIRKDAPITLTLKELEWKGRDTAKLTSFYEEVDFKSFLKKLDSKTKKKKPESTKIDYTVLTEDNINELSLSFKNGISFYLEMSGDNYHLAPLVGFVIAYDGKYFVSRNCELLKSEKICSALEDPAIPIDLFDGKRTFVGLARLNVKLSDVDFDLLLVSYLLNASENSNDLGKLAQLHDYTDVSTDEEVYGKGAKYLIPEDDQVFFNHLCSKLQAITALKSPLLNQLKENKQEELYIKMERPLSFVLGNMELAGIRVDQNRLEQMGSEFKERIEEVKLEIYNEAGEKFNLNSPKQLGVILFEKLKLPVIKKTKTGYSTAVGVLEQLRGMAPIVDNILKYRQIAKIQSTYVEGLLKYVSPKDSKVHTRYTQTLTATGRLSSVDPNLQNIPIRLPEGKKIRQVFVPRKENWEIFSSDYSQIELRVLAHISHDENMQAAFKRGADIHANTAMQIFGLESAEQVTPNMRRQAKAVNFGIVYGISDYGLAQNIGISRKQAKDFIDRYFKIFPGVHQYMKKIVEKAHKTGYVETLFKRRRYLPDITSKNFNLRSFSERTAMNTPIQGSAADIIKVAMINMQKMLKKEKLQAVMLLQVHDELIFEAPQEELKKLKKLVPNVMDEAVSLEVPLKVESSSGKTWYDTK